MEKKVIKKILALLMILTILTTDFFVLGSNLITYASQNNSETNNSNIEFSAYFKNEKGEAVDSIDKSIKTEDLKLYAEIKVKNEGYFNGTIEIVDSNFNIKDDILSTHIAKIENNAITLKQINAGETVEIELGIEPTISDKMTADMLSKTSTVKITGTYMESTYEGLPIEAEKLVKLNYQVDETAKPEIETKIITNQIFSVNGTDKKIVQLLIKSRLSENQYPVEQTTLSVNIPEISETEPEVKVLAANGRTNISDYKVEQEKVLISLNNNVDGSNQINWYKNGYDEVIVTFAYGANVDTSAVEITTNLDINVYNSNKTYKTEHSTESANMGLNNTILTNPEITTTELYKGQLYANTVADENKNVLYNKTTTLVVTDKDLANEIVVNESLDKFVLIDDTMLDTDSKYESTKINKQQMLDILGTSGSIIIKSGEKTLAEIANISEIEEDNIVINYEELAGELQIETSKPVAEGILEIIHTKKITENNYSRAQIKTIKEIKTETYTQGTSSAENPAEAKVELKETVSKAELIVLSDGDLSSTEVNDIRLGITLNTEETKYDLFKNPEIAIQLPATVENVEFSAIPTIQNVSEYDDITIQSYEYDNTTKQIKIKVRGEQTIYPEGTMSELYIPLDLKITLSRLATTQNSPIKMMYTNANASEYYSGNTELGETEQLIGTEAPAGLIKYFNINLSTNTSISEDISQRILNENAGQQLDFEIVLVNNTESDMSNVKVLGILPTTGVLENTLETTLKDLTAQNATVYFTENANATEETNKPENGWTTEILPNAKLYLIEIGDLAKGNNYNSLVKVQLPKTITNGIESFTQYEVIYDIDGETQRETSRKIGLKMFFELEVELTAQVGQEILNSGDTVKEGEVIRYTASVTNMTNDILENIQLKADVPEGTVVVEPVDYYVYSRDPFYYEEKTDIKEIDITIPSLGIGETFTKQYEIRVNMDAVATVAEISNKVIATHGELQIESDEIKNVLKEADMRVTIKRTDDETAQLVSGGNASYIVYLENYSDKNIENLKMEIISNEYNIINIKDNNQLQEQTIYDKNTIYIDDISAKGVLAFAIYGEIVQDVEELQVYAKITNSEKCYRSNIVREKLPKIEAEITLSSAHENQLIKPNEQVTYNITIQNRGETINGSVIIKDFIPEYLQVEAININGNAYLQTINELDQDTYIERISNETSISVTTKMEASETIQVDIVTRVKEIPTSADGKVITNKVELMIFDIHEDTSEEVKHILDCGQKNIISGFAWLDTDADGKKEDNESALAGITVKLYNISIKNYLKDTNNNVIAIQTGTNGEYEFTQIPNGSYVVVFEHGLENYEPTTYQANGTQPSENSKAKELDVIINGESVTVAGITLTNIQDAIITNANIGLKEKGVNPPKDDGTDNPENPDTTETKKNEISGFAWLDLDRDGEKDDQETGIKDVKVKLYDVSTSGYLKDKNGTIIQTFTDAEGKYKFSNIEKGLYIVIFEYNTEEYEPTTYLADGVDTAKNSKVVLKKININEEEQITAVTDTINLQEDVSNINIGLREKIIFDLELNKYISRIVVQDSKETKAYDYENQTFAKVEIHRKRINGSLVVLEYTIKVKNNGESAGYAKNIVDYLPSGLTFSSELNTDWYLSGNYLFTKGLEKVKIEPGQEKEIKLILTKTMTNDNAGLINNRAEIYQDYNEYGATDVDSIPNNLAQNEDDLGSADVIILVSTGGGSTIAYITLLITNIILICIAIKLMIKNKIIKISTNKRGRR